MSQLQPDTETLSFKIGLSATFWKKLPEYSVLIDDIEYANGQVGADPVFVEFTADLEENKEHNLVIRLNNKTDEDVVKDNYDDPSNFQVLADMLLNIDSIEIDQIDLDKLRWTQSQFIADDQLRPKLDGCVNLGWNGRYVLKFICPFYLWLLEKL